ncbi:MAG: cell division/cell wall cluster transcriptional repressor MraZ [Planctomycetes bacterium]|nr:cell division/cell wall cluster transcriptional repressor MraZ [Planctomycetota bacterium]
MWRKVVESGGCPHPALLTPLMTSFTGQSDHKLDTKGRLFVPRRLIDSVEEHSGRNHFVLTIGEDPCLYLFTLAGFEEHLAQLRELVQGKADFSKIMRGVAGLSSKQDIDSQGRILLPEKMRAHVGLEKSVVVIGVFDHIEIWDEDLWNDRAKGSEQAYLDTAAIFFRGGPPAHGGAQ